MTKTRRPPVRSSKAPSTPSLERREREKAETRALILAAARELFTREGYERTTMRAIAEKIGYTATAIYHHFADKNALMLELCVNDFKALHSALTAVGRIPDPVDRLRMMGKGYVRFATENPEQFRFMFLVDRPQPSPDQVAHLMNPGEDGYVFLQQAVTEAMNAGRFRDKYDDPNLLAQIFWAAVHGIACIRLSFTEEKQNWIELRGADKTTDAACEALFNGLLAT